MTQMQSNISHQLSVRTQLIVMSKGSLLSGLAGAIASATASPHPAAVNLIFAGSDVVGGSGFGALPSALTIQPHGPSQTTESGCIAPGPSAGGDP